MHDVVIIGGGVAGLSAGMYAGRLGMKTLTVGENIGGTITLTTGIENYPGFKSISGSELAAKLKEHAQAYGAELVEDSVTEIKRAGDCFEVFTSDKKFLSRCIIFATGTRHRKLEVPGSEKFESKGVHYCALCDGPFYRGKVVAVIGGGDSAAKEALLLANYAKKVYMIYRGEKIRPEPINARRIEGNKKIEVITRTNVIEIKGDAKVSGAVLDREYKGERELKVDGIFVAIGGTPLSELARKLGVESNEKGEIKIDRQAKTNVNGIFAAGDIADTAFKQAITGAAEGVTAAYSAYRYINEKEFVCTCIDEEYVC